MAASGLLRYAVLGMIIALTLQVTVSQPDIDVPMSIVMKLIHSWNVRHAKKLPTHLNSTQLQAFFHTNAAYDIVGLCNAHPVTKPTRAPPTPTLPTPTDIGRDLTPTRPRPPTPVVTTPNTPAPHTPTPKTPTPNTPTPKTPTPNTPTPNTPTPNTPTPPPKRRKCKVICRPRKN